MWWIPPRLKFTVEVVWLCLRDHQTLRRELKISRFLHHRKVVEKAKGLLMKARTWTDGAYHALNCFKRWGGAHGGGAGRHRDGQTPALKAGFPDSQGTTLGPPQQCGASWLAKRRFP